LPLPFFEVVTMTPDEIAKRYDALRKSIPKLTQPNMLVLTCGVAGLGGCW